MTRTFRAPRPGRGLRLTLASPDQIRSWSSGEVKNAELLNYQTLEPVPGGLFCEQIFGPFSWNGKARPDDGPPRMGHRELASPVGHSWFTRGPDAPVGLLLDLEPRALWRVLACRSWIVTAVDEERRARLLSRLHRDAAAGLSEQSAAYAAVIASHLRRAEREIALEQARVERWTRALDQDLDRLVDAALTSSTAVTERLRWLLYQSVDEPIDFPPTGAIVVPAGARARPEHLDQVLEAALDYEARQRELHATLRQQLAARGAALVDGINRALERETERLMREHKLDEPARRAIQDRVDLLSSLRPGSIVAERVRRTFPESADDEAGWCTFETGGAVVRDLLAGLDLEALARDLRAQLAGLSGDDFDRGRAVARLELVEALRAAGVRPEWLVLTVLPIAPTDRRPILARGDQLRLHGLNDLYRRVIHRDNRLRTLIEVQAPEAILRRERGLLQRAVDQLVENEAHPLPARGRHRAPLLSLTGELRSVRGRFRPGLLERTVDFSGYARVVPDPTIPLDGCGLPERIAYPLFRPFLIRRLLRQRVVRTLASAVDFADDPPPRVWYSLAAAIRDHPVLLSTVRPDRTDFVALLPRPVGGAAIRLHPLVYARFAQASEAVVHLPLSAAARAEARDLLTPSRRMMSPDDDRDDSLLTPDALLGLAYLVTPAAGEPSGVPDPRALFANPDEAILAHELGRVTLRAWVTVRIRDRGRPARVVTTVGRLILNRAVSEALALPVERESPVEVPFLNDELAGEPPGAVVERLVQRYGAARGANLVESLNRLGWRFATRSGLSADPAVPVSSRLDGAVVQGGPRSEGTLRDGLSARELLVVAQRSRQRAVRAAIALGPWSAQITATLFAALGTVRATEEDCCASVGLELARDDSSRWYPLPLALLEGRRLAQPAIEPSNAGQLLPAGHWLDQDDLELLTQLEVRQLVVRSPLTCRASPGVCYGCLGRDPLRAPWAELVAPVGPRAALEIGRRLAGLASRPGGEAGRQAARDLTRLLEGLGTTAGQDGAKLMQWQAPRWLGPVEAARRLVAALHAALPAEGPGLSPIHLELMARELHAWVRTTRPGDSSLRPGQVERSDRLEAINRLLVRQGRRPAEGEPLMLGLGRLARRARSPLAAARLAPGRQLRQAALAGQRDPLTGMIERVVAGARWTEA